MTPPNLPTVTINGATLPKEAIAFELQRLVKFHSEHMPAEQVQAQLPEITKKAVEQAIGARLLMDEANRLDIPVPDSEIEKRLNHIADDLGGIDQLKDRLAGQGITLDAFRENIRRGAKVDLLIERITAGIPDPSEADLRAHFDAHRDEYTRAERVLAQHILIAPDGDSGHALDEARAIITDLQSQLKSGADFALLASQHSHCPSGQQDGGSLGWFSRGMMVPEFENAVFAMANDELSEPVQTQFGWHLIKRLDHEPSSPADFEESRDSILDFLRHHLRGEAITARVAQLRENAEIKIAE